jgi:hypothetical protein
LNSTKFPTVTRLSVLCSVVRAVLRRALLNPSLWPWPWRWPWVGWVVQYFLAWRLLPAALAQSTLFFGSARNRDQRAPPRRWNAHQRNAARRGVVLLTCYRHCTEHSVVVRRVSIHTSQSQRSACIGPSISSTRSALFLVDTLTPRPRRTAPRRIAEID